MSVGRFQVMAILQAARAYVLGLPKESALSFGLNRAIFYAAAKRGFKHTREMRGDRLAAVLKVSAEERKAVEKTFKIFNLGDEMAYSVDLEGKTFFIIGNEIQTPERFEKQIAQRFGKAIDKTWGEAVEFVKKFDRGTLLSQRYFYEAVYKPRRDELAEKWTAMVKELEESS